MNRTRKPIFGVGINDVGYVTQTKTWKCPYYRVWKGILERCYSERFKTNHPSYNTCSVRQEWLTFSTFKSWMESQNWEGLCIDKDVLVMGNKEYGPDKCVFVPHKINCMFRSYSGRKLPMGVTYKNDRTRPSPYQALVHNGVKQKSLGYFSTPLDAHYAWQLAKISEIEKVILWYKSQDCYREDVANALMLRIAMIEKQNVCQEETLVL